MVSGIKTEPVLEEEEDDEWLERLVLQLELEYELDPVLELELDRGLDPVLELELDRRLLDPVLELELELELDDVGQTVHCVPFQHGVAVPNN